MYCSVHPLTTTWNPHVGARGQAVHCGCVTMSQLLNLGLIKAQKHLIWAVKDFKIMYQCERERERERERPVVPRVAISSPSTSIIVEMMEGLLPAWPGLAIEKTIYGRNRKHKAKIANYALYHCLAALFIE